MHVRNYWISVFTVYCVIDNLNRFFDEGVENGNNN
jgi:hypothetical protein